MKSKYPKFLTEFEDSQSWEKDSFYSRAIEKILSKTLPPSFFEGENVALKFHKNLPLIAWTPLQEPPFILSFYLCSSYSGSAPRFFYEMITNWLIPGKKMHPILQFATDFFIPEFGQQKYTASVLSLRIENLNEFEILKKNLPVLEREIRLGVESPYQASRILEVKGIAENEKTTIIQQNVISLIRRRPQDFDYDVLSEMASFLVICKDEFTRVRTPHHMSRIICVHYLFRKALKLSLEVYPERRYISVKLIRAVIEKKKPAIGIAIGISFIRPHEHFEENHAMSGIKAIIPDAKQVEGSFFMNKSRSDSTATIYLEIEKEAGQKISLEEERDLKSELPQEFKSRIEVTLNSIFMPQNEEVIMRHILTLSNELKLVRDLPQVVIEFNQQTEEALEFRVIILRLSLPESIPFFELIKSKEADYEIVHDRTKVVGTIRKKHKKEATVLLFRMKKIPFLRKDHSVDLNRARQAVVRELSRLIGDFRDFNGGIIAKETELFETLRQDLDRETSFLLENFFYSLKPPLMRSLLPQKALKTLFFMLLDGESELLSKEETYSIRIHEEGQLFYLLVSAKVADFWEILSPLVENFEGCITYFFLANARPPAFGALVKKERAYSFKFLVEKALVKWSESHSLLEI